MSKVYNEYDGFAHFYNKYWTGYPQKLMAKALDNLLLKSFNKKVSILDICCGTGDMAAFFRSKGHRVSGVDGSDAMLEYARENVPDGQFYCFDVRLFELKEKFDAVTCLFDSINHITEEDDVEKVFANAFRALKKGGVFVFDANSLDSCRNVFSLNFSEVNDKEVFVLNANYDEPSKMSAFNITIFDLEDGVWVRRDTAVYERYYSPEFFFKNLKKAGFENITIADNMSGFRGDRLFFRGEKS